MFSGLQLPKPRESPAAIRLLTVQGGGEEPLQRTARREWILYTQPSSQPGQKSKPPSDAVAK